MIRWILFLRTSFRVNLILLCVCVRVCASVRGRKRERGRGKNKIAGDHWECSGRFPCACANDGRLLNSTFFCSFFFLFFFCLKAQTCIETNLGYVRFAWCTLTFNRRMNCSILLIFCLVKRQRWRRDTYTLLYAASLRQSFVQTTICLMGMDHVGNKPESWLK